jgi:uncharacterized protein YeaO (DUF488 family)
VALKIKRVTEPAAGVDGARILVDRLWPRGQSKQKLKLAAWMRDVAPSNGLRQWYGHDPSSWEGFRRRYRAELDSNPDAVGELEAMLAQHHDATLLFAARDVAHSNAAVLVEYLREHAARRRGSKA